MFFRWKTTFVIIIVVTWRVQTEEETTELCIVCSFNPCKLLNNQKETLSLIKTVNIYWIYSHQTPHNPLMIEKQKVPGLYPFYWQIIRYEEKFIILWLVVNVRSTSVIVLKNHLFDKNCSRKIIRHQSSMKIITQQSQQ